MRSFVKHMARGTMLDDAPWTWGGNWSKGMPEFFSEVQKEYPGSEVYGNVWDKLDDSPVVWHISEVTPIASFCAVYSSCNVSQVVASVLSCLGFSSVLRNLLISTDKYLLGGFTRTCRGHPFYFQHSAHPHKTIL